MQKYQLLHWALILFSMHQKTTKGMYVACTTETCSRVLKDELMATARRSRYRHLDRNRFACKLAYHVCKEYLLLLNNPLYYSWNRCQYGDVDRVVWPPRTPAVGLQFQVRVLTCSVQLIIAKFEKLYTKIKKKIWVNALTAVILLHDNTCPHAAQLNGVHWECSNTMHTACTYDHVIFTGLDTWKTSW